MATSNEVIVTYSVGLHARPAAVFAKKAAAFTATIVVENLTKGTGPVNAKSVLRILSAGIERNDHLRITADGTDEDAAVDALSHLIDTNFAETE